jgi:two-component system phosphate regulon sensor histidine kinase PhoR
VNIPNVISTFFGTTDRIVPESLGGATVLSLQIVSYAIELASQPQALKVERRKLRQASSGGTDEATLAHVYLAVENYLITRDPLRTFEMQSLRDRVRRRFAIDSAQNGMALLFMKPEVQELKLGLLVLSGIMQRSGRLIGTEALEAILRDSAGSGVLRELELTSKGLVLGKIQQRIDALSSAELDPVLDQLESLFAALKARLSSIEGTQIEAVYSRSYLEVKSDYGDFIETLPRVATLLPSGIMEEEKLRYLSRDTLELRVQEKTHELELEKASIEQKVRDRTRQLAEEQAKLTSIVESISPGLIMVGEDQAVVFTNTAAIKMLGLSKRTWTLADVDADLGEQVDLASKLLEVIASNKPFTQDNVKFQLRILRLTLTPVRYGKRTIGVVILMEDETEAKIIERSKDEFFSIASHELRTPLTAIRGNTSMIQEYFKEQLKDPQMNDMVADIHDSSVRLIEIVNDFLDASRLEQGKMKFTFSNFDVDRIIEKVVYELSAVSSQKHIKLRHELGTLPQVYADPDRVKQVLYNLIGNALKFMEKGSITIDATVDQGHMNIAVIDTGRGISGQGQSLLFHKFQQTGSSIITRDTTSGTGLGLYISRQLLQQMNGQIALVRSEIGVGSTFSFTLPLAKTVQPAAQTGILSTHKG